MERKHFYQFIFRKLQNTYLMFDQRMNRPQSDQFFFQLEPQVLSINKSSTSKEIVNGNSIFRLKLMKGFNQCDQMKKKPTQISTDGKVIFPYTQLTFYLPTYNPDRPIYFTLLLLKSQQGKEEKEIGKYAIKSSQFIEKFKKQQKRMFRENIAFNSQYELTFNLFIDKSRIQLEKFVREVRQSHKKEEVKEKEAERQPVKHKASLLSQSVQGKVSSTNQDGFISSQRKIVRKQGNQRKLLIKNNNSPQRSQDGSQRSRELKFSRKSSQRSPVLKSERRTSLADQQIRIEKEAKKLVEQNKFKEETRETGQKEGYAERIKLGFLHTPDNKQSKIQNHSQDDGILDFDSDKWVKSSKNLLKLSDRKGDHPPMMKKTGSQLFDQKGKQVYNREKPQKKKQLHESYVRKDKSMINKPQNTTNQNILMGVFLLISCYILYLVMQPSRKF